MAYIDIDHIIKREIKNLSLVSKILKTATAKTGNGHKNKMVVSLQLAWLFSLNPNHEKTVTHSSCLLKNCDNRELRRYIRKITRECFLLREKETDMLIMYWVGRKGYVFKPCGQHT